MWPIFAYACVTCLFRYYYCLFAFYNHRNLFFAIHLLRETGNRNRFSVSLNRLRF